MKLKSLLKGITGLILSCSLFTACSSRPGFNALPQLMPNNFYMAMSTPVQPVANGLAKFIAQDGSHTLYIEPQAGIIPILEAVKNARTSVDIQVYMLTMRDLIEELINAAKRNVKVRLILEKEPFNPSDPANPLTINIDTQKKFEEAGVLNKGLWITWSNKQAFTFTHQKSIIIDGKIGYIMSLNLSYSAVVKNREYFIADTRPAIVNEMKKIFEADWNYKPYTVGNTNLVISPINSRKQLESLIVSSKKNLSLGFEVTSDPHIINLLIEKFKAGVKVNLMLGHQNYSNVNAAKQLSASGFNNVRFLEEPFLHGKIIISDNKAYIGSINLTTNSMERNRELGIILTDNILVNALKSSYDEDFTQRAHPLQEQNGVTTDEENK